MKEKQLSPHVRAAVVTKKELELKMFFLETVAEKCKENRIDFKFQCIETGGAVPDTIISLDRMVGWLEFKRISDMERKTVKYEPGQHAELQRWRKAGVFSATLGITENTDFVVAEPQTTLINRETNRLCLDTCIRFEGEMPQYLEGLLYMMRNFYGKQKV